MKRNFKVVIVEDHAIVRQGLRALLESGDDLEVVGEAGEGLEAIHCIQELQPHLVVLDLNMPKMGGISVVQEVRRQEMDTKILALTMHKEEALILEAFRSGVNGYCLKSADHDELIVAIRAVLDGKSYVSPEISDTVLEGWLEGQKTIREESSLETLTQREREILKLVGEGHQNKEIADYLCISPKTVEKHRANIMEKTDLHTASALTAYAIEKGLVTK